MSPHCAKLDSPGRTREVRKRTFSGSATLRRASRVRDFDYGLVKFSRRFLRKIVAGSAADQAVSIWSAHQGDQQQFAGYLLRTASGPPIPQERSCET